MQTLQRTNESFTTGIVNLPIILQDGLPVKYKVIDREAEREHIRYKVVPDMRYPFFELDRLDKIANVLASYRRLKLPVYVHRTMRGYHFLSNVAIHKDCYSEWLKPLMKYNPKCPMVTLRVKPNKWVGERKRFLEGTIYDNGCSDTALKGLQILKTLIENQMLGILANMYYVVHYKMTGELGNL